MQFRTRPSAWDIFAWVEPSIVFGHAQEKIKQYIDQVGWSREFNSEIRWWSFIVRAGTIGAPKGAGVHGPPIEAIAAAAASEPITAARQHWFTI